MRTRLEQRLFLVNFITFPVGSSSPLATVPLIRNWLASILKKKRKTNRVNHCQRRKCQVFWDRAPQMSSVSGVTPHSALIALSRDWKLISGKKFYLEQGLWLKLFLTDEVQLYPITLWCSDVRIWLALLLLILTSQFLTIEAMLVRIIRSNWWLGNR